MLLGLTRGTAWAKMADDRFKLGDPEVISFTCVVCVGEILALAERNGWGGEKRAALEERIGEFPQAPINDREVLDAYARIDAWSSGKAVDAPGNAPPPKPAARLGQNDLWIAAATHASGAILLSTDSDFERLSGIWIQFERIEQGRGEGRARDG